MVSQTPEKYAETKQTLEFVEREWVKGMEFAKFYDEGLDEHIYCRVKPNGDVGEIEFVEVYSDGNLTIGKTHLGLTYMVDDDGIHEDW